MCPDLMTFTGAAKERARLTEEEFRHAEAPQERDGGSLPPIKIQAESDYENRRKGSGGEDTDADDGDGYGIAGPQRSFRPMSPSECVARRSDRLSIER